MNGNGLFGLFIILRNRRKNYRFLKRSKAVTDYVKSVIWLPTIRNWQNRSRQKNAKTWRSPKIENRCNNYFSTANILLHLISDCKNYNFRFQVFFKMEYFINITIQHKNYVNKPCLLFLVSLLDHPLVEPISGWPPPPSLQFVWSKDDSDATLPPPPTLYMSSRSLSIRSVTEYRIRCDCSCVPPDDKVPAAAIVADTCCTCTNRAQLLLFTAVIWTNCAWINYRGYTHIIIKSTKKSRRSLPQFFIFWTS